MGTPPTLILAAASAASAATMELVEAARERDGSLASDQGGELAISLRSREVSEILADALQSTLTLLIEGWPATGGPSDEREMHEQLRAAVARYLEGWAR